jgi:hypothetical protein
MTKKRTGAAVIDQVLDCIMQYEAVGASASEVADEIMVPARVVHDHIRELADEGQLHRTSIRRPWKRNVSDGQAPIRQVYVAMQFKEA